MDLRATDAAHARQLLRQGGDEDGLAVQHRSVIGHVVLSDDPAASMVRAQSRP